MSDPIYQFQDYIFTHDLVRSIGQNLAIQFQMEGENWDRATMQKHVNDRAALIRVQQMLMDAAEHAGGIEPEPEDDDDE